MKLLYDDAASRIIEAAQNERLKGNAKYSTDDIGTNDNDCIDLKVRISKKAKSQNQSRRWRASGAQAGNKALAERLVKKLVNDLSLSKEIVRNQLKGSLENGRSIDIRYVREAIKQGKSSANSAVSKLVNSAIIGEGSEHGFHQTRSSRHIRPRDGLSSHIEKALITSPVRDQSAPQPEVAGLLLRENLSKFHSLSGEVKSPGNACRDDRLSNIHGEEHETKSESMSTAQQPKYRTFQRPPDSMMMNLSAFVREKNSFLQSPLVSPSGRSSSSMGEEKNSVSEGGEQSGMFLSDLDDQVPTWSDAQAAAGSEEAADINIPKKFSARDIVHSLGPAVSRFLNVAEESITPAMKYRFAKSVLVPKVVRILEQYKAALAENNCSNRAIQLNTEAVREIANKVVQSLNSYAIEQSICGKTGIDWNGLLKDLPSIDTSYPTRKEFIFGKPETKAATSKTQAVISQLVKFEYNNWRNITVVPLLARALIDGGLLSRSDASIRISELAPAAGALGFLISLSDFLVDARTAYGAYQKLSKAEKSIQDANNQSAGGSVDSLLETLSGSEHLKKIIIDSILEGQGAIDVRPENLERSFEILGITSVDEFRSIFEDCTNLINVEDGVIANLFSTDDTHKNQAFKKLSSAINETYKTFSTRIITIVTAKEDIDTAKATMRTAVLGLGRAAPATTASGMTVAAALDVNNAASHIMPAVPILGTVSGLLQMAYRADKFNAGMNLIKHHNAVRKSANHVVADFKKNSNKKPGIDEMVAVLELVAAKQSTGTIKAGVSAQAEMFGFGGTTATASIWALAAGTFVTGVVAAASTGIGLAGVAGATGLGIAVHNNENGWKSRNTQAALRLRLEELSELAENLTVSDKVLSDKVLNDSDIVSEQRPDTIINDAVAKRDEARLLLLRSDPLVAARYLASRLKQKEEEFNTSQQDAKKALLYLLENGNFDNLELPQEYIDKFVVPISNPGYVRSDIQKKAEAILHLLIETPFDVSVAHIQNLFNLK